MVIQNDDIRGVACSDCLMTKCAAIYANDQIVFGGQFRHGSWVRPISFVNTVRDIERAVYAKILIPIDKLRSRCSPIHIIICKNRNAFFTKCRRNNTRSGGFHIL